jgi:hypothetical protein
MSAAQPQLATNYTRRSFGVLLAILPFALLLVSLLCGLTRPATSAFEGGGLMAAATAIALLNFHLSFIRPVLYSRRHGSLNGYRHVSGFPLLGTILVCLGALGGFGAIGSALVGMVAYILDTGSLAWFVISTWRDGSFWDE